MDKYQKFFNIAYFTLIAINFVSFGVNIANNLPARFYIAPAVGLTFVIISMISRALIVNKDH